MSSISDQETNNNLAPDLEKNPQVRSYDGADIDKANYNELSRVHTSTDGNGTIVHMGPYSFRRDELVNAFGGDLNPATAPRPPIRGLKTVPMGLCCFAYCAFTISLFHVGAENATDPSIFIGASLFYGGVIEFVAGLVAVIADNTYPGTVLACFGGFWISFGAILCDSFDIQSAYKTTEDYNHALGLFLIGWVMFSFVMWLFTFKSTWPFFTLLLLIWVWIMVLDIGVFTGSVGCTKAAGVIGMLASFNGLYLAYEGLSSKDNTYLLLPSLPMP